MDLKPWLDAERGRYTGLAKHLDVSVGRVSQIADDGVPVKFMEAVEAFTGGAVTVVDMVRSRTGKGEVHPPNAEIAAEGEG